MSIVEFFKKIFYQYQEKINAKPLIARFGILLVFLLVIFLLWLALVYPRLYSKEYLLKNEQLSMTISSQKTTEELDEIIKKLSNNPYAAQQLELNKASKEAEKYLEVLQNEVIPADEMSKVLRDVLLKEDGLSLKDFNVFPIQTLVASKVAATHKQARALLYEQNVQMTFSGNYFAVINYLKHLESLPWRFFWDDISYNVTNYPEASVTIKLHTLGLNKETSTASQKPSEGEPAGA